MEIIKKIGTAAKNGVRKTKEFVSEHKEVVVGSLVVGGLSLLGCMFIRKVNEESDDGVQNLMDCTKEAEWIPGRDCVLRCYDEETGEQLDGEVLIAESYWDDLKDIAEIDEG